MMSPECNTFSHNIWLPFSLVYPDDTIVLAPAVEGKLSLDTFFPATPILR